MSIRINGPFFPDLLEGANYIIGKNELKFMAFSIEITVNLTICFYDMSEKTIIVNIPRSKLCPIYGLAQRTDFIKKAIMTVKNACIDILKVNGLCKFTVSPKTSIEFKPGNFTVEINSLEEVGYVKSEELSVNDFPKRVRDLKGFDRLVLGLPDLDLGPDVDVSNVFRDSSPGIPEIPALFDSEEIASTSDSCFSGDQGRADKARAERRERREAFSAAKAGEELKNPSHKNGKDSHQLRIGSFATDK